PDRSSPVVRTDDNRHTRKLGADHYGNLGKLPSHPRQGRLWITLNVGESEPPIVDLRPTGVPIVGPGKDEGPGAAGGKGGADLGFDRSRLRPNTVAQTVQADLSHD